MSNAVKAKPLSNAQLMVLQVVKEEYNEQDLEELRKLLLDFNSNKMQQHLDEIVAQKGYGAADFEKMLTGHMRKTQ